MANEAVNIKTGVLVKLPPDQIVVKSADNGRFVEPDRRPLILRILEAGRVNTPLVVRKIEQGKVQLVAGYGRHAAVTFIDQHLTDGVLEKMLEEAGITGVTVPSAPIKLPCIAETMSAEEAFRRNISENDDRTPTSYVDRAFNIRKAIQVYGMTEDQARYIYPDASGKPKSPAWLSQMLKITTLDRRILDDIIKAEGSANVCFALADMPEDARAEVLALAKEDNISAGGNGAVTATEVMAAARKKNVSRGKSSRKMAEVKALLEEFTLPGSPFHAQQFAKTFLSWIADEAEDEVMKRQFRSRFKDSPKD